MSSNRSIVVSALSLLVLLPVLSPAARAQEVRWSHYKTEPPESPGLKVPCGHYGTLIFEKTEPKTRAKVSKCLLPGASACGAENPAVYPSPPLAKANLAKAQVWLPCDRGECFLRPDDIQDDIQPEEPWVAVIDWDNQHGWSIGWTIDHLANPGDEEIPLVLFALYDAGLEPFSALGATDVHVLKKLCEVAQIADLRQAPPLVINMSFGRLHRGGGATDATSCDVDTLRCQIAHLLRHLACDGTDCPQGLKYPRTVPVAAAGNHRRQQFPAVLPEVVAAGALQLGLYRARHAIQASWETPEYEGKARALLPGYALCLESSTGEEWPAPPGSSYSAAIFSGWLASLLKRVGPLEDPFSKELWFPARVAEVQHLAHGGKLYNANPNVQHFFNRLFVPKLKNCQSVPSSRNEPLELQTESTSFQLDDEPSFIEVLDDLVESVNGPTPPDRPCVPCLEIDTGAMASNSRQAPRRKVAAPQFRLDRISSELQRVLFPDYPDLATDIEEIVLKDLYLRLEERTFRLEGDLTKILLDARSLNVLGTEVQPEDQPSLIYIYDKGGLHFWSSVPLLVRAEQRP